VPRYRYMKITDFKEDDIITREEPNQGGDRSYQNDRLLYIGTQNGMIVLIQLDGHFENEIIKLGTDWWNEGWNYYPQSLLDRTLLKHKQIEKEI